MYFKENDYDELVELKKKLGNEDIREVLKVAAKALYAREFPKLEETKP